MRCLPVKLTNCTLAWNFNAGLFDLKLVQGWEKGIFGGLSVFPATKWKMFSVEMHLPRKVRFGSDHSDYFWKCINTLTHARMHTHTPTHAHAHTCTHTHAHTHTHACTHMHPHTHTHACTLAPDERSQFINRTSQEKFYKQFSWTSLDLSLCWDYAQMDRTTLELRRWVLALEIRYLTKWHQDLNR